MTVAIIVTSHVNFLIVAFSWSVAFHFSEGGSSILMGTFGRIPFSIKLRATQFLRNSHLCETCILLFKIGLNGVNKLSSMLFRACPRSNTMADVEISFSELFTCLKIIGT